MSKRLELLSDLVPQAGVIALLVNPSNPNPEPMMRDAQEAARAKGAQLHVLKADSESEIDAAFASLIEAHAGALVIGSDPFFRGRRRQLVALASRHAVPTIYDTVNSSRRRPDQLWTELRGQLSPGRHLRRKNPRGRQACRPAGSAANEVRAGREPQDREGARPDDPANDPDARRRGDRIRPIAVSPPSGPRISTRHAQTSRHGCREMRARQNGRLPLICERCIGR
jgi:hypothetical protein